MLKTSVFGFIIGAAAVSSAAQPLSNVKADQSSGAYLQDERGVVVRSEAGLCWRGGQWNPNDSLAGCDGALVVPVVKATAPEIVALPVKEAPAVPAPVPAAPVVQAPKRCDFGITLENDQSFDFNRALLQPAARKRLDDEILAKLSACVRVDMILVTGHADRLGTHQYNQKLSLQRAEAVASYLRSKSVSAQIETMGMGKTQAIKDCSDALGKKRLIVCLAPNRRVVIEVRGAAKAK